MLKQIVIISLLSLVAHANIIDFYQEANKNIAYDKTYSLYKKSNQLSQSGIESSQYANFSADMGYVRTRAKLLNRGFNTTDFALSDTLDVFGKNSYKIEMLQLDLQSKKASLALQKEQLFISLANMIAMYHQTKEQEALYQDIFDKEDEIYKKLQILEKNGAVTQLDVLRFNNRLNAFQSKIVSFKNQSKKMEKQLNLYAPNQPIPLLDSSNNIASKEMFLAHNPRYKMNSLDADKQMVQAKGMEKSYTPMLTTEVAYQQIDDPTSFGNNYSLNIGIHIPLNQGDKKEAEALKASSMSNRTKSVEYKFQRENEYISRHQSYLNAQSQLDVLSNSLENYEKSEESITEAYLKQYVDLNTYLQLLIGSLGVKEQMIAFQYQRDLEKTIVNAIALGEIYE